MSQRRLLALASSLIVTIALAVAAPAYAAGPALIPGKPGGVMNVLTREDLAQGFSTHESVTLSTIWPAQPCFNNLVTFDPVKPLETFDTVVSELAEKWSWQDRSTSSSTTPASRRGTTRAIATRSVQLL